MPFCRKCGAELARDDKFCGECGTPVRVNYRENPLRAASARAGKPAGSGDAPVFGGIGARLVAQIVDGFVLIALFWVIGFRIAARTGGLTEGGFELEGGPALMAIGLTMLGYLLYFSLLEGFWNGQTLGKKLAGIQVVDMDGTACSFSQALIRNVIRFIDGIGFYLVGLLFVLTSPKRQRLGDRWAGTVVIKKGAALPKDGPSAPDRKYEDPRPSVINR